MGCLNLRSFQRSICCKCRPGLAAGFAQRLKEYFGDIHPSFLQNGLSEVDYSWAGRGEPGCVRSGRGGPVVDDANDLIDGERDDAEHEMAFDLERAADAEKSGAELVFQTGVDAFGHGAEIVDQVVEVGHVDELQALDLAAPFGLAFVVGAKVAVDDRGAWPSARLWSWIAAAS